MLGLNYTIEKDDTGVLVQINLHANFNPNDGDIKIDFIDPESSDDQVIVLYSTIMRANIIKETGGCWAKFTSCQECSAHLKSIKVIISRIQSEDIFNTEDKPKKKAKILEFIRGSK